MKTSRRQQKRQDRQVAQARQALFGVFLFVFIPVCNDHGMCLLQSCIGGRGKGLLGEAEHALSRDICQECRKCGASFLDDGASAHQNPRGSRCNRWRKRSRRPEEEEVLGRWLLLAPRCRWMVGLVGIVGFFGWEAAACSTNPGPKSCCCCCL